jgi:DNA-binding NtrC family response regulator
MNEGRGRILVVEDKQNMRALLCDILSRQHDVSLAADGAAARAALESGRYEVVLTDVRMPGMDGFEIIRLIKERWPITEVVMMTAFASIPSAVDAIKLGAYDYLKKPFDPDDVDLIVTRALQRHRERSAAPAKTTTVSTQEITGLSYREALAYSRDKGSREYLSALLKAFGGNVSRAAERAGLERESLHRLLRRYGIQASTFRDSGEGDE